MLEHDRILQDIADAMYPKNVSTTEVIVREGEVGSHMYVSAYGSYEVLVKGKVTNRFEHSKVFGEIGILYDAKRNATIKATKPGKLWVIDRCAYQQIVIGSNIKEQNEILTFLKQVPNFNKKDDQILQHIGNLLRKEFFNANEVIVRQGDRGDKFYIIRVGTVTVSKNNKGIIGILERGQFFGERALLEEDCRQATVTANNPGVECLTLTREEFLQHFLDFEKSEPKPLKKVEHSIKNEYSAVELKDLVTIRTLGVGGFGRVELRQHIKNKNWTFAVKCLKKIHIVGQRQQEHVFNEKTLQMACNSIFIVQLYKTFRDSKYLYFLMEPCLGGDLCTLLQKQRNKRFLESEARFLAACTLEALSYIHDRNIIYRDLKPENLVIDNKGYVKLADFGFAKKLGVRGKAYTFGGTPEYVAPEVILNRGHDKAVDYWALGILIFELLHGRTPFKTESRMKTFNLILRGIDNIIFNNKLPPTVSHLIKKLCKPMPIDRLGCLKGGAQDIRNHRWFKGFEWDKLYAKTLRAPWVPRLKSNTDTSHFDHFPGDNDIPPDDFSGWDENF